MTGIRTAFCDSLDAVRPLLARSDLAARWHEPSALAELRVSGLAGHLARAAFATERYLAAEPATGAPIAPADYFLAADLTADPGTEQNRAIRDRGEDEAAEGPGPLLERFDGCRAALREALGATPADRLVAVFGGLVLTVDDYLVTRLVEVVVHTDDLAVSLDVATPAFPAATYEAVRTCLLDMARGRHGELAVIRALARRERDPDDVLRVL